MKRGSLPTGEMAKILSLTEVQGFRDLIVDLWTALDEWCADKPYHVVIDSGARTPEQQMADYAKGRTKTSDDPPPWGSWEVVPGGHVVTKSLPEQSAHCYAAAVDMPFLADDGSGWIPARVDRTTVHPAWLRLKEEANARGLESGGEWGWDWSHVDIRDWADLAQAGTLVFAGGSDG